MIDYVTNKQQHPTKMPHSDFGLAQPSDHQIKIFLALLSDTVIHWEFSLYIDVCVCVFAHDMT